MKLLVPDTNLFIDLARNNQHEDFFVREARRIVLCSVVAMEVYAGSRKDAATSLVARLERKRLITPEHAAFQRAGKLLSRLRAIGRGVEGWSHDALIAMTARQIGGTVVTTDPDFEVLQKLEPFDLDVV